MMVSSAVLASAAGAAELAHWPLDDGAGLTAVDVSPQGLDGTFAGGVPGWTASGVFGGALDLDGVDDLVVVEDDGVSPLDLASGLTLALWIDPATLQDNRSLVAKDGSYELDLSRAGTGTYSLRLNNLRHGKGDTQLVAGAWQHVAVTWDGLTVRYYHQGLPDGTASYAAVLAESDNDLGLGGRPASFVGGSPQFLFEGSLDDVRIYDRALSATEILAVFQNQPLPPLPPDAAPPVRSAGSPTGTLPFGTTDAVLELLTDEPAKCRRSDLPGTPWGAMTDLFASTGGAFHADPVGGLQNGGTYTFYVRCRDGAGNENGDDLPIAFDVEAAPPLDLEAPLISSPFPVGTLPPGIGQVDLTVQTDEDAECRYAETPGTGFGAMPNVFQVTGGRSHTTPISGLVDGTTRIFYVRCRDTADNSNPGDFRVGFFVAEEAPGSGFHPTDLPGVSFFVESRHGLLIATCDTDTCRSAGDNVPLELQYCDRSVFPDGCLRRWEDQSVFTPPVPFEPPEWTAGHDFGQDDLDKPGLILDCLNGRPCLRGGFGEAQARSLEIEPNQPIGPADGPFSLYVLAKPVPQATDFYYLGYAGTELLQRAGDHSLRMRVGFGSQIPLTGPDAAPPGAWHLIEVHRDVDDSIIVRVDGWDLTEGSPAAPGDFYFRFLFTVSRLNGFFGDLAAALVVNGPLTPTEQTDARQYFGAVYGLTLGDGGPPPPAPGLVPQDGLVGEWTFDDGLGDCLSDNGIAGGPPALPGPACPGNVPVGVPGKVGDALQLDGIDDQVEAGTDSALDLLTELTVSAWVRTTSTDGFRSIVDKRDASQDGFDLYLAPGGVPFMRINHKTLLAATPVADGQWHHLVGVFDGGKMRIYVDGVLDAGRSTGPQALDTQDSLWIGRNFDGPFTVFDGFLDQVRVYDTALESDGVSALFGEN